MANEERSDREEDVSSIPTLAPMTTDNTDGAPDRGKAGDYAADRYGRPLHQAMDADGPLAFVQALRLLRENTGRSFHQIANSAQGRLPKSTLHYMTHVASEPELTRLPARAELVELFVRGCGRPETEVQAWVREWRRIKQEMRLAKEATKRLRPVSMDTSKPPTSADTEIAPEQGPDHDEQSWIVSPPLATLRPPPVPANTTLDPSMLRPKLRHRILIGLGALLLVLAIGVLTEVVLQTIDMGIPRFAVIAVYTAIAVSALAAVAGLLWGPGRTTPLPRLGPKGSGPSLDISRSREQRGLAAMHDVGIADRDAARAADNAQVGLERLFIRLGPPPDELLTTSPETIDDEDPTGTAHE